MPFEIVRNDITRMDVDAIVNAANNSLLGGGGVDGAIHRAAGPRLLEECRTLNGCETGQAKLTRGYDLPCKYVIHTVGPIWQGGGHGERTLLTDCYRSALALAKEYRCESVAFPLISSGAYGYPRAEALKVAVDEITAFLEENDMLVYLVVFTRDTVQISGGLFQEVCATIDDAYVDGPGRVQASAVAGPEASMGPGDLFRRAHREDNARNETVFADRAAVPRPSARQGIGDINGGMDESFSEMLIRKIEEKGITGAACCKRANVDRRLFSRIRNNPDYRPGKPTALAFAVALELSIDETRELLGSAGYALSRGSKADIVVEYCLTHGVCDLIEINLMLFKLDLQPLGF